jgi:serine/threonine-protein kinase RsbW
VFLAQVLEDCPAAADAVLMADELAANAVLHSHSGHDGGMFTVHVEFCERAWLQVSVRDEGGPTPPLMRASRHPDGADGGQGLRIVNALSDTWGVTGGVDGRTVWFRRAWEAG